MDSRSVSRVSRTPDLRAVALAVFLTFAAAIPARAATPVPLDYPAYDAYDAIAGTTISGDGRYAAYVLTPGDGDPTLVIHDFEKGTDLREARGTAPHFTADSKVLIYTLRAPNDELRKSAPRPQEAERTSAERPRHRRSRERRRHARRTR